MAELNKKYKLSDFEFNSIVDISEAYQTDLRMLENDNEFITDIGRKRLKDNLKTLKLRLDVLLQKKFLGFKSND